MSTNRLRIIGGKNSLIKSYPYMVSFEYKGKHICGGSIINENYILTAAHCLDKNHQTDQFAVRTGSDFRNREGSVQQIEKLVRHENYYENWSGAKINDIALVKLKEPLIFDETHQPIKLFEWNDTLQEGSEGVITGWGNTGKLDYEGQLQRVILPVIDQTYCDNIYNEYYELEPGYFCAGYIENEGKDSCHGDSGGPFVVDGRQAGIVSWGVDCASPGAPGIYTEIAFFRGWIDKHIE